MSRRPKASESGLSFSTSRIRITTLWNLNSAGQRNALNLLTDRAYSDEVIAATGRRIQAGMIATRAIRLQRFRRAHYKIRICKFSAS